MKNNTVQKKIRFALGNLNGFTHQNFLKKVSGGFTLVETLVAISVFTMSVLTLVIILSQGITSINYAKQKIIAGYLSQEGIEYTRNIRDTNVISHISGSQAGWNAFKTQIANCLLPDGCYLNDSLLFVGASNITVKDIIYTVCPSGICPPLKYDLGNNSNGRYNYSYGFDSTFTSKIMMTRINDNEIKVISIVYWKQGSTQRSVTFSENLFNWIE